MARRELIYGRDRAKKFSEVLNKDESQNMTVSGDVHCDDETIALSTASWEVVSGRVTLGSSTEAGNKTTALVKGVDEGPAFVKVTLTFDDTSVGIVYIRIEVQAEDNGSNSYD